MRLILTNHALKRMRMRGVTEDQIRTAIRYPDRVKQIPQEKRVRVSKDFGKKTLDVVYRPIKNACVIITVIWLGEKDRYYVN